MPTASPIVVGLCAGRWERTRGAIERKKDIMNIERIKATDYVTTLHGLPGMSSQEIAEITGEKHGHALRDIQKMLGALVLPGQSKSGPVQFIEIPRASLSR